jgi:S-layer homology domain
MKILKKLITSLFLIICCVLLSSCTFFNVKQDDELILNDVLNDKSLSNSKIAVVTVDFNSETFKEGISSVDFIPESLQKAVVSTDTGESIGQVTSISQFSDVSPTDQAFQPLQSLVERYGCVTGYSDSTFRGNRALTRYEFAYDLNSCLDRVSELISSGTADSASKESIEELAAEMATLRGRMDSLEARVSRLEASSTGQSSKPSIAPALQPTPPSKSSVVSPVPLPPRSNKQ